MSYHKSTDGGKTFKSSYAPHGDHHDLWIAPEDAMRMIMGDDGGAQISCDGGETWSTYHNQPTAQFYRVTTDNAFRTVLRCRPNRTIPLCASLYRTRRDWSIGEDDWEDTAGESAHIAVDPENPTLLWR